MRRSARVQNDPRSTSSPAPKSCVDWPGCWQWREFAELCPELDRLSGPVP